MEKYTGDYGNQAFYKEYCKLVDALKGIGALLELLAQHKGSIVSTASLSTWHIDNARASGRMYVDSNNLGYVWMPESKFPESEEEVEELEKWYPLPVETPEKLKTLDWLWERIKVENQKKNN